MAQGTDPAVTFVLDRVNEAQQVRGKEETQWDRNMQLYRGDHWNTTPPKDLVHVVVNLTKRAVDAIAAVMTENRPRFSIMPREPDGRAMYFLKDSGTAKIEQAKSEEPDLFQTMPPEQVAGELPMTDDQFDALQGFLTQDDVQRFDDGAVAEVLQDLIGCFWDKDGWDWTINDAIKNCIIVGSLPILVEWDEEKGRPVITDVHPKNFWMDPTAGYRVEEADYAIIAEVMSVSRAITLLEPDDPKRDEKIRGIRAGVVSGGTGNIGSVGNATIGGVFNEVTFQRDMVIVLTCWARNEDIDTLDENNQPIEIIGLRQIKIAGDVVIEDGLSPYSDIPLFQMVNIPKPFRPYGIGEPEVLEDLQLAINRLASIFVNHTRFFQNPQQILTTTMVDAMKANKSELFSFPGRAIIMEDETLSTIDPNKLMIYPPSLNGSYIQLYERLIADFYELAGNTDVIRGQASNMNRSGVAIQSLQQAARGTIGFPSLWLEEALTRLVDLVSGMITDFMSVDEFPRYIDRMEPEVFLAIKNRMKDFSYDTTAEVASGKGENRRVRQEKAMLMRQQGDLSLESFLDDMEHPNPAQEKQRLMQEQAEKMQLELQAQMAAAALTQQPEEGDKPDKKSDKKKSDKKS